jgi:hypothetical protein
MNSPAYPDTWLQKIRTKNRSYTRHSEERNWKKAWMRLSTYFVGSVSQDTRVWRST